MVNDLVQDFLALRQQGEALACQLVVNFLLLLKEEEQLAEAVVLDKFLLEIDSVEQH